MPLLRFITLLAVAATACDNKPPTIIPLHPTPGDTVYAGEVEFRAVVRDRYYVADVSFTSAPGLDRHRAQRCSPDTFWVAWNTSGVPMGEWYNLTITADDDAENRAETTFTYYLAP